MMTDGMNPAMLRGLAAAGTRAGNRVVAARIDDLAELAAAVVPDAAISVQADGVRVAARGLRARLFGSRRRGPDPRLAQLAGGGR
jgi:hypothetical protein